MGDAGENLAYLRQLIRHATSLAEQSEEYKGFDLDARR